MVVATKHFNKHDHEFINRKLQKIRYHRATKKHMPNNN